jgi:hypothetical protein
MSKQHYQTIALATLACLILLPLGACAPYVVGGVGIAVGGPPPPLHVEVRVAAPGPGYFWVPGYWDWVSANWIWVGGSWRLPPHAHERWVPPRYTQRRGHWTYRPGYWH